jgi:hypothetical protein
MLAGCYLETIGVGRLWRGDVLCFADGVNIDIEKLNKVKGLIHGYFDGAVLVVDGIWYLAKK